MQPRRTSSPAMAHAILPEPTIPTLSVNGGILGRSDSTGEKWGAPYAAPPGVYGEGGEYEFSLEPVAPMLVRAFRGARLLAQTEKRFSHSRCEGSPSRFSTGSRPGAKFTLGVETPIHNEKGGAAQKELEKEPNSVRRLTHPLTTDYRRRKDYSNESANPHVVPFRGIFFGTAIRFSARAGLRRSFRVRMAGCRFRLCNDSVPTWSTHEHTEFASMARRVVAPGIHHRVRRLFIACSSSPSS